MSILKVSHFEVKTNSEGMYCINDLHKASGGKKKDQTSNWLALPKTSELIEEVLKTGITGIKTTAGRYGGTYVCKELVYAYAMWVSAKFSLEVIKVFDSNYQAESSLQSLAASVRTASRSLSSQINETSVIIDELKGHGTAWSSYGSEIKKAKSAAIKEFEELKNEIQIKLDLI